MNIIIPIGGQGARFTDAGYTRPKPLIHVLGKPMIYWVLDHIQPTQHDHIIIVHHVQLDTYHFDHLIRSRYPAYNFHFVSLHHQTRGPIETIHHALSQIKLDLSQPLVSLDCDTFYTCDVNG